jgi:hypothetical protein
MLLIFISEWSAENNKWKSRKVILKRDWNLITKKLGISWSVILVKYIYIYIWLCCITLLKSALSSGTYLANPNFQKSSYKGTHFFTLIEYKLRLWFTLQTLFKTFIVRRIERYNIIKYKRLHVQYQLFLSYSNLN